MGKLYLFSEVKGVVVHNGEPVAGAVVEQSYRRDDEQGRAETKTDAQGQFRFAAVIKQSLLASIRPHQPLIHQSLLIKHEGTTYKAWLYDKLNYAENGELDGKPISLYCSLEAPLEHTEIRSKVNAVYGICELGAVRR